MVHLYPKRALLQGEETGLFKLMSYGATPEQWAEWLRAPLEHAAASGNLALITKLLEAGASGKAGWRGCRGRTLLDAAALGGNPDVVYALLQAGARPDVNVIAVSSGRSALYLSVVCGHEGAARQLLVAGADVDFVDPVDQCGPLHAAVDGGHGDLVAELLIAGACPSARNEEGSTPLHVAARNGNDKIVSLLLNTTADNNAVVDKEFGFSPLMEASKKGHLSTVEMLLTAGVDESIRRGNAHESALDLAAQEGNVGILKALLKNGADVNAAGTFGYTALHNAALYNKAGAVGVLLGAGAKIEVKTSGGKTVLFSAVHSDSSSARIVHALLQRGAKVDERDRYGNTPLHVACGEQKKGMAEVVDLLLRWGASETDVNSEGASPAGLLFDDLYATRKCSMAEMEHARVMLRRAPADRLWRRRCWLPMLRSRAAEKENIAQRGGDGNRGGTEGGGELAPGGGEEGGGKERKVTDKEHAKSTRGGRGGGAGDEGGLSGVVTVLLGLDSQKVFRTIVGYL